MLDVVECHEETLRMGQPGEGRHRIGAAYWIAAKDLSSTAQSRSDNPLAAVPIGLGPVAATVRAHRRRNARQGEWRDRLRFSDRDLLAGLEIDAPLLTRRPPQQLVSYIPITDQALGRHSAVDRGAVIEVLAKVDGRVDQDPVIIFAPLGSPDLVARCAGLVQ